MKISNAGEKNVDHLIAMAQKTRGWNNRSDQPCAATIDGGCILHIVPAWLWQPRIRPRIVWSDTPATPLRRQRA